MPVNIIPMEVTTTLLADGLAFTTPLATATTSLVLVLAPTTAPVRTITS
jgi:hypothetical protein